MTTRWTESCSGCTELVDGQNVNGYPWDAKAKCYVGSGCRECGYTGKRRMQFDEAADPIPMDVLQRCDPRMAGGRVAWVPSGRDTSRTDTTLMETIKKIDDQFREGWKP